MIIVCDKVRGWNPVSHGIAKVTRSPFTHVFVVNRKTRVKYECRFRINPRKHSGVQVPVVLPRDWEPDPSYQECFEVPLTPIQLSKACSFWRDHVGDGYDIWSIRGFAWRLRKPDPRGQDLWTCSEYIFSGFYEAGVHLLERVFPSQVAPGHIVWSPLLQEHKWEGFEEG